MAWLHLLLFALFVWPSHTDVLGSDELVEKVRQTDVCERVTPNCGTGKCVSLPEAGEFKCVCPRGHSQENENGECRGVFLGGFGDSPRCHLGLRSESVTALTPRTLRVENFTCEADERCARLLHHAYFMAEMGKKKLRLSSVQNGKCSGTHIPTYFPFTIDLEFPEDWEASAAYNIQLYDISNSHLLSQIELSEEMRDQIAELDDPEELKCHHSGHRVLLGRFGEDEGLSSENVEALNSRLLKVHRFRCDSSVHDCQEVLEAAVFVAEVDEKSEVLHTIVHERCKGFTLPPKESLFTLHLELPEFLSVSDLTSLDLWDHTTKKTHSKIVITDSVRDELKKLPKPQESRCIWAHEDRFEIPEYPSTYPPQPQEL